MEISLNLPDDISKLEDLKYGDIVLLTGIIYSARDAAHKRMFEMIQRGEKLPFDIKNQIIYYVGPCPARENEVIGSAGPTTSSRMDKYSPILLDLGLKGMIGKGKRSDEVTKSIVKNKSIYFGATGGAGALLAKRIIKQEIIAFEDLGTESIRKITVKDFPLTVIIDSKGQNLYDEAIPKYKKLLVENNN